MNLPEVARAVPPRLDNGFSNGSNSLPKRMELDGVKHIESAGHGAQEEYVTSVETHPTGRPRETVVVVHGVMLKQL